MIHETYCIMDIETWVPTGEVDPEKDIPRYVGFKNHLGKKVVYHISQRKEIQAAIDYFPVIVNHNLKEYDVPVLKRFGFNFYGKVFIDTLVITENRVKQMMYIDLNRGEKNLRALCERFNLPVKKGHFDYSLLEKETLEGEEYRLMVEYLEADLDATDCLFRHYYEFFYGFREFMNEENQRRMSWLCCKPGATAYKAICNIAELPEEYDDVDEPDGDVETYKGGYVSEPYTDFVKGNLAVVDARSLYPHMMMMFCLYNPVRGKTDEYFKGSEIYPSVYGNDADGISGKYLRQMGPVEKAIQLLFKMRMDATEAIETAKLAGDKNEKSRNTQLRLAIKILINTAYGILGSPKFKSVHSMEAAADCTALARRTIKHARICLERMGYECLYTDTDSVYLKLPKKGDYEKLQKDIDFISEWQRSCANIPIETHGFALEAKIKRLYFFKGDDGKFVKKQYIYVTDDDKIKTKGLMVVKGNCSKLAKEFYETIIKRDILKNKYTPYSAQDLLDKLKAFSVGNEHLLEKRYRANPPESYKVKEGAEEATCINYQIAKKYGAGEHFLVINKRIGAGKGNKYAKMTELKEKYGEQWVDQVCFEMYLSDLKVFIDVADRNKLHKTDRKRITKGENV